MRLGKPAVGFYRQIKIPRYTRDFYFLFLILKSSLYVKLDVCMLRRYRFFAALLLEGG
jgi:hypothetical protein